ncbi:MAG: hypothetical protein RBT63_04915 [Bdellovibrionales bacterium]|jgi:hypothetical protein|nr:hypothetical protein [Bdellovibrionales bacterium]
MKYVSIVAFFITQLSAVSPTAHAQTSKQEAKPPSDTIVYSEVMQQNLFGFILGAPTGRANLQIKTVKHERGNIQEWTNDRDVSAIQYGKDSSIKGDVWRLSEVRTLDDSITAVTTTFYQHGVRSKTVCDGKVAATPSCVTATRTFCSNFKRQSADLGINTNNSDTVNRFQEVGEQCAVYAEYLDKTLDPNKIIVDYQRSERDRNVVERDIAAIHDLNQSLSSGPKKSKGTIMRGMDDWFGKGNAVGVSSSGMKQRSNRLKEISNDFRSLSHLAAMCSEITFVSQDEVPSVGIIREAPSNSSQGTRK